MTNVRTPYVYIMADNSLMPFSPTRSNWSDFYQHGLVLYNLGFQINKIMQYIYWYFCNECFFNCLCYYNCSHFFPFSHLHPYLPSPLPVNPLIIVCVHGLFKNILWLILLPFSSSPSPSPLATVNLFHVSMILLLFCSLVYCVH